MSSPWFHQEVTFLSQTTPSSSSTLKYYYQLFIEIEDNNRSALYGTGECSIKFVESSQKNDNEYETPNDYCELKFIKSEPPEQFKPFDSLLLIPDCINTIVKLHVRGCRDCFNIRRNPCNYFRINRGERILIQGRYNSNYINLMNQIYHIFISNDPHGLKNIYSVQKNYINMLNSPPSAESPFVFNLSCFGNTLHDIIEKLNLDTANYEVYVDVYKKLDHSNMFSVMFRIDSNVRWTNVKQLINFIP